MKLQDKYFFIISILMILLVVCTKTTPTTPPEPDYWPTQGWHSSIPEQQGVDSAALVAMIEYVQEMEYEVGSVVVIRHGYKVAEIYFYPFRMGQKQDLYSCSKSVMSALIGIAIERGYIQGVDQPLLEFFPGYKPKILDERKQSMTLENLLTMTTGFDFSNPDHNKIGIQESNNWVRYVLDYPMIAEPGTHFEYHNYSTFLLSAIITKVTRISALDFAQEVLFSPLGITDASWEANPDGITYGFGDLFLQPGDMAKFGYLYLHGGEWGSEQIVPAEWVETSTRKHIWATWPYSYDGYGYQWWTDDDGYYMALGKYGQAIFVLPDLDMVVVIVSRRLVGDSKAPEYLLTEYIIPAATPDGNPLPENAKAYKQLQEKIEEVAEP